MLQFSKVAHFPLSVFNQTGKLQMFDQFPSHVTGSKLVFLAVQILVSTIESCFLFLLHLAINWARFCNNFLGDCQSGIPKLHLFMAGIICVYVDLNKWQESKRSYWISSGGKCFSDLSHEKYGDVLMHRILKSTRNFHSTMFSL